MIREYVNRLIKGVSFVDFLNIAILFGILLLPYLIFEGKFYVGGDDTRLYYLFPGQYLDHITSSAWFKFSSTGSYNPNFFLIPLLLLISVAKLILYNNIVVSYLFFSLPILVGFIFFQKLMGLLLPEGKRQTGFIIGAMLYVLSPITIVGQLDKFLYSVWLLPLLPIIFYYMIHYLRTGAKKDLAFIALWSALFSVACYSIPWLLGALMPIIAALLLAGVYYLNKLNKAAILRSCTFMIVFVLAQAFWLLPFINSVIIPSNNSYGGQALSAETADTFSSTVQATATGNIFYPLISFFHRQIAFDFHWELADVYRHYYDFIAPLGLIFPAIMIMGLLKLKHRSNKAERFLFVGCLLALLVSLYLFTVNIGVFRELFMKLGAVPGFAMFRNGYDKFALGYIFLYSIVFSLSLHIVASSLRKNRIALYSLYVGLLVVVIANAVPIKQLINRPLWTTKNIYTTIDYPEEYINFMSDINEKVPPTSAIIDVPFNISSYSVIKDPHSNNVFAGRSPVKILANRDDYSGSLSFSSGTAGMINDYIRSRSYDKLKNLLRLHNIQYILETNNIPDEVKRSYLFEPSVLAKQDSEFRAAFFGNLLASSSSGNYKLYAISGLETSIISATSGGYALQEAKPHFASTDTEAQLFDEILSFSSEQLPVTRDLPGFSSLAYQVPPNQELILNKGNYSLDLNGHSTATLHRSPLGYLGINNNVTYTLDEATKSITNQAQLSSLKLTDGLLVDSNPLGADEINSHTIEKNDQLQLLSVVSGNLVKSDPLFFQAANKEDCNQHKKNTDNTTFTPPYIVGNGFSLASQDRHNACLRYGLDVEFSKFYRLQFEYKTNSKNLKVVALDESGKKIIEKPLPRFKDDQWHQFSEFLPVHEGKVRLYLYSGEGDKSSYKSLAVHSYTTGPTIATASAFAKLLKRVQISVPTNNSRLALLSEKRTFDRNYYDFNEWHRSDCNSVNSNPSVYYEELQNGGVMLGSEGGHNACIYHDFKINPNDIYQLELKYEKKSTNPTGVYIDFGIGYQPLIVPLVDTKLLKKSITPPSGASTIRVYLYSGEGGLKNRTSIKYNEIQLSSVPKYAHNNTLLSVIDRPTQYRVNAQKLTEYRYRINAYSVNKNILINFKEAFHPGWQLHPKSNPANATAKHTEVNNYSNGWYIDVDQLCKQQNLCKQNADGSYDMELVAEFTPQRWFYVGLIVSGATLIGSIGYLVYSWRRRKSESDDPNDDSDDSSSRGSGGGRNDPGPVRPRPPVSPANQRRKPVPPHRRRIVRL